MTRAEKIERAAAATCDRVAALPDNYAGIDEGGVTLVYDPALGALLQCGAALRAALALPDDGESGVVRQIRAYAVKCAAVCREAELDRCAKLGRSENSLIFDMLREQRFAWDEKAKSYDALVSFIDSLHPAPSHRLESGETDVEWLLRQMAKQDLPTLRDIAATYPMNRDNAKGTTT